MGCEGGRENAERMQGREGGRLGGREGKRSGARDARNQERKREDKSKRARERGIRERRRWLPIWEEARSGARMKKEIQAPILISPWPKASNEHTNKPWGTVKNIQI